MDLKAGSVQVAVCLETLSQLMPNLDEKEEALVPDRETASKDGSPSISTFWQPKTATNMASVRRKYFFMVVVISYVWPQDSEKKK